jgi:hypothetical protein
MVLFFGRAPIVLPSVRCRGAFAVAQVFRPGPLKAERAKEAGGTVQVGDSDDAPKIDLAPGKKKETLETPLGNGVKFPLALTLLLHLPSMEPDAKPELFNFKFTQFTDGRGPGSCSPMANVPNMRC